MNRTPRVDAIRVNGRPLDPAVAESVTTIQVDRQENTIGEVTVDYATGAVLATDAADLNTAVTFDGEALTVANVSAVYAAQVQPTVRYRSKIGRSLLAGRKQSVEKNTSPSEWVTRRVKRAGGRAICQPTAKRKQITQKGGKNAENDLDVLQRLADDIGFAWAEQDGVLVFGARDWALRTTPRGSRTLTRGAPTLISAAFELTPDSDSDLATGTLTLTQDTAATVRLWEVTRLTGFGQFSGAWLVTGISGQRDGVADWNVDIVRPRKRGARKNA